MRKLAMVCFVILWACLCSAQNKKTPVFTSFDYPGSVDTEATGINASGDIVGRYYTFDGTNYFGHGFLFTNGQFQPIDFPDSIYTDVTYISSRGEIVGSYNSADGVQHGFVLRNGAFTTIDYPDATGTAGFGIGPNGEVVGTWWDQVQNHGYIMDNQGRFTLFDYPGLQTLPTVITAGRITGFYTGDNWATVHGFVVKNGKFQTIDFPAIGTYPACETTYLSGLNPQGDMVGGCIRSNSESAWLVKDGEFVPISYPGSLTNYANGINPQGQIVGRYMTNDGHFNHGFLLTWKP